MWVGSPGTNATSRNPLQLALSDPATLDHQAARKSLDRIGKRYRVSYASASLAGLTAVVRSGQAIAVLTQTGVPPDLQVIPSGLAACRNRLEAGHRTADRRGARVCRARAVDPADHLRLPGWGGHKIVLRKPARPLEQVKD